MFYLPEAHTDFVFAVITEDFGIIGALVVFLLFGTILVRGMRIARAEPDPFASLLAVGLTGLLSLQALMNLAVVIGLVPTKGLPLPFLSYGGTSMVMALVDLGRCLHYRGVRRCDEGGHSRWWYRGSPVPGRCAW